MALNSSMAEALRLTRSGNLAEAAALLQSALRTAETSVAGPRAAKDAVIDLVPERVSFGDMKRSKGPASAPGTAKASTGQADAGHGFEQLMYRGNEGSMSYWLYSPPKVAAGMPLVVMLHGCTQSPEDFARGTGMNRLADELGFLVAYPAQTSSANPQKCWNWFRPGDQQRDRGEPALLAGITRRIIADHAIDADRVYVAGLSAGGAAAAIMAAQYPDIYAAVGIHSGLACGAARDLPSALAAMKRGHGAAATPDAARSFVPVITFHGDNDSTVHEVNSSQIIAAATAAAGVPLDVRVEQGRSSQGRSYSRKLSVDGNGAVLIEQWTIQGSGHAWSGGHPSGSYTDASGADASREMLRFFLEHKRR